MLMGIALIGYDIPLFSLILGQACAGISKFSRGLFTDKRTSLTAVRALISHHLFCQLALGDPYRRTTAAVYAVDPDIVCSPSPISHVE
jgi:hypothetical protein